MRDDPELDLLRERGYEHETPVPRRPDGGRSNRRSTIDLDGSTTTAATSCAPRPPRRSRRCGPEPTSSSRRRSSTAAGAATPTSCCASSTRLDRRSSGEWQLRGRRHEARPTRQGRAILQMCVYVDLLEQVQGVRPSGCTSPWAGAPARSSASASTTTWPTTVRRGTVSWHDDLHGHRRSTRRSTPTRTRSSTAMSADGRPSARRAVERTTTSASWPASRPASDER